jgi:hypothetical protein
MSVDAMHVCRGILWWWWCMWCLVSAASTRHQPGELVARPHQCGVAVTTYSGNDEATDEATVQYAHTVQAPHEEPLVERDASCGVAQDNSPRHAAFGYVINRQPRIGLNFHRRGLINCYLHSFYVVYNGMLRIDPASFALRSCDIETATEEVAFPALPDAS